VPLKPSIHEVAHTTTLYGGNTGPATVSCPQGEVALGGGWSIPAQDAHVFAARLTGSNTWAVSVAPSGHTASRDVTAYVECLRHAPGAVVASSQATSMIGGGISIMDMPCTEPDKLVGWGFDIGAGSGVQILSVSHTPLQNGQAWRFYLQNSSVSQPVTVFAQCLSNVPVNYSQIEPSTAITMTAGGGGTSSTQVSCPVGSSAIGYFGYDSFAAVGEVYQMHATATGWRVAVHNGGSSGFTVTLWARCLSFP
jgi:hypothetical protein